MWYTVTIWQTILREALLWLRFVGKCSVINFIDAPVHLAISASITMYTYLIIIIQVIEKNIRIFRTAISLTIYNNTYYIYTCICKNTFPNYRMYAKSKKWKNYSKITSFTYYVPLFTIRVIVYKVICVSK